MRNPDEGTWEDDRAYNSPIPICVNRQVPRVARSKFKSSIIRATASLSTDCRPYRVRTAIGYEQINKRSTRKLSDSREKKQCC